MDRANDRLATWEEAALYKVTEGAYDLGLAIWSQKMSFAQSATASLLNMPTADDFMHWGHSVNMLDLVDGATQFGTTRDEDSGKLLEVAAFDEVWAMNNEVTKGFGRRGINSWGDSFGDMGEFILTGNKAISDGAVGIGATGA
jgi:hypothetical protein